MSWVVLIVISNLNQNSKMKEQSKVRNVRLILLGNTRVGKTSLILRYTENSFNSSFSSTLGVDFKFKKLTIDGVKVKAQIWDTGGQERFHTITKRYYGRAMGVILVYDSGDAKSFQEIKGWMMQIENHARKDVAKMLVAAKCDEEPLVVAEKDGREMAAEYGMHFLLTSSKTGKNVKEAFDCIITEIIKKQLDMEGLEEDETAKKLDVSKTQKKSKGCCCNLIMPCCISV
eukprot:TRINITY_DN10372_c0_g3_i2.p1 TRINITY_DN10372_c0_g3~~TRINITY_DN10372_c0_g3_i2.p1  ORF type:complete len:230 (-),score=59.81 TRINITY_DN10372_c0_g3_i2:139-828(-)